ncbi:FAD-dependent oxidoreductase [Alkalihalobacillus macyae]|uniref:oxidoreductase n=1 Tax=Guptibacillus hwajinpoensis TaxID=208199 RepID=UPI00273CADE1|nr:FAD-dependent oxidoreductase [Alkalihalobacillus macyae]MDP4553240.1 FAD-dependent oxidoreductase [Alkalihalobacillus macyae]
MEWKKLFEPIQLRRLTLPNRIMMGSMHLGMEGSKEQEEALISFYTERSGAYGPGIIVTGGISVSPEGDGGHHFLGFYRDEDLDVMRRLTERVHIANGRIAAQLFHAGRYAYSEMNGVPSVAPSPIKSPIHRETPVELSELDILNLLESYAEAGRKAKEVGFDAVEIMGSEGYLINQFLSPSTNKRTDKWGGDFEKRTRFAIEVLKSVRQAVGNDYPIIFRMSGLDLVPNSSTPKETIELAKRLEANEADLLNIGIGWHESTVPTISMMVPRAGFIEPSLQIKQAVNIPVVGSNRINDPELAEELLHKLDMVSMARPFLADPHLLKKAKEETLNQINTCIACNQACLDHAFEGKAVSCLVNPRAGREHKWHIKQTKKPKNIVVIGGGVAGMEAARAHAELGHKVVLYEAGASIGGQFNLARKIPIKKEFDETIRFYTTELQRLGVHVALNHKPSSEDILSHSPHLVVLATGVTPRQPVIPGIEHTVQYPDILSGTASIGKKVVIIGAGGIGCDVSHFLIEKGINDILLLRRNGKMGEGLGKTTKWAMLQELKQNGVRFRTNLAYEEITENGIRITDTKTGKQETLEADTVILAAGQESNIPLEYQALEQKGIQIAIIGGARLAGELDAKRAIYEGAKIAFEPETIPVNHL